MVSFSPLKILFILPALTAGGAERVMITLMNGLDKSKFTPELLAISGDGPLRDIINQDIPFHCLNHARVLRSLPALHRKIKEVQPCIVISTMAHMNFTLLMLKPFFPKTKFIVREAITPDFILQEHPRLAPLLKIAYRQLYKRADLVISPAQIIIDGFKDDLSMVCKNHVVLHNPVDMDKIRASEGETFEIAAARAGTVHFVSAGRLHSQKGFDRLISALPHLKMSHNWHLSILGEGPERENLEALIRKNNLQDHISLPGLSANPWPYFTRADCFLMPSRWEGLPNVILEALACGIPSIATSSSGGIAEISAAAPEGLVNVVDTIDEFIAAMEGIVPCPTDKFRTSLLPDVFDRQNILDHFSTLLKNTVTNT